VSHEVQVRGVSFHVRRLPRGADSVHQPLYRDGASALLAMAPRQERIIIHPASQSSLEAG
jgi:hypothetical protein